MPQSRYQPSGRFGGDSRPPAGPFCYCPMHCPVTWDAYEAMMQEWTKGAPPPGYWYPPPLHQPPPPGGLSEEQQNTTKDRGDAPSSQKSTNPPSETPDEEEQDPGSCLLPSYLRTVYTWRFLLRFINKLLMQCFSDRMGPKPIPYVFCCVFHTSI